MDDDITIDIDVTGALNLGQLVALIQGVERISEHLGRHVSVSGFTNACSCDDNTSGDGVIRFSLVPHGAITDRDDEGTP